MKYLNTARRYYAIVPAALVSGAAMAQDATLPASVASGFDNISSQGSALFDLAVPVVMAILGSMIILKLIKRFGNKV